MQSSYASFFCVARVSEILGGCERVITEGWSEEGIVVAVWVVLVCRAAAVRRAPWQDRMGHLALEAEVEWVARVLGKELPAQAVRQERVASRLAPALVPRSSAG